MVWRHRENGQDLAVAEIEKLISLIPDRIETKDWFQLALGIINSFPKSLHLSVGHISEDVVKKYIQDQKKK